MTGNSLTILAFGDLILEEPHGDYFLNLVAPILKSGDIVIGQGEVVFTSRGVKMFVEIVNSPGCPPSNMGTLAHSGFNVITLAGNHVWDLGTPGIEDTLAGLRNYGIATVGAGMNIDEARKPAIIERKETRIGFLNYNCVGLMGSWATQTKPGSAYVRIITAYEMNIPNPGATPDVYTFAEPRSLKAMISDIQKLRPLCDILVVALHKGILGSYKLAMYDQQVSYAAIDAGADLILGHHAHMLKGVELYKGKVIFHGLGRFVPAIAPVTEEERKSQQSLFAVSLSGHSDQRNSTTGVARLAGDTQRDPASKWNIIAKCMIDRGKISRVSYLPCLINEQRQPEVLKNDERGRQLFDFMDMITGDAGLDTRYEWDGDEVMIHTDETAG
jgi:poly-gamma-glutamate synthesis protein (capsule biosynthesis protein)